MSIGVAMLPKVGVAQTATGNRANGFNYQPTPAEVDQREKKVGVRQSAAQQLATDRDLEDIDRMLLRNEGMSTKSVPDIQPRP